VVSLRLDLPKLTSPKIAKPKTEMREPLLIDVIAPGGLFSGTEEKIRLSVKPQLLKLAETVKVPLIDKILGVLPPDKEKFWEAIRKTEKIRVSLPPTPLPVARRRRGRYGFTLITKPRPLTPPPHIEVPKLEDLKSRIERLLREKEFRIRFENLVRDITSELRRGLLRVFPESRVVLRDNVVNISVPEKELDILIPLPPVLPEKKLIEHFLKSLRKALELIESDISGHFIVSGENITPVIKLTPRILIYPRKIMI